MKLRSSVFFLVFCCAVFALGASTSHEGRGYIFTCPRVFAINQNNQLEMFRIGNLEAGSLKVSLFYKESYDGNETLASVLEYQIQKGKKRSIYSFFVSPFPNDNVYGGRIQIEGNSGDQQFNGTDNLRFATPKKDIIVVQTDKALYKTGQTVRMRFLYVDSNLKPTQSKNDVGEVYIEDPKGTRLFQQNGIYLGNGLAQTEFQLADEPVLGTWTITLKTQNNTESTTFDVKQYQLPKFEVKIKFPPFTLATTSIVPITVCANFTYGKPVQGTLNLNISIDEYIYYYYSSESERIYPIDQKHFKLDGCYTYNANITSLQRDPENPNYYSRIKVVANVVQEGTGVQINATEYLQRTTSPLTLSFDTDNNNINYFKPGLPYNGKVTVKNPDDTPAGGEIIELSYTVTKQRVIAGYLGTRTVQYKKNFTADSNGQISFTIPPQNVDATSISIVAQSYKYSGNNVLSNPYTSQYLSPFYSPSGSYIQLANEEETIPCGTKKHFKLLFTSPTNSNYKFYYEVLKQGRVVLSRAKKVSFTEDDDVSYKFEKDNRLINDKEETLVPSKSQAEHTKSGPSSSSSSGQEEDDDENCPAARESKFLPLVGEAKISLEVESSLSDGFTLLVFFVRSDGETVADSRNFKVDKCFKNQVNFKFGDSVKQPGQNTSIQITASPNSLCGVRAIDKSVTLLNNNNQLTKDKIFQLINDMNIDDYYPEDLCNQGNPMQPGLEAKIILPPGPDSSSSSDDSYTVFQTSGLLTISNLTLFTRKCQTNNYIPPGRPIPFRGGPVGLASGAFISTPANIAESDGLVNKNSPASPGAVSTVSAVEVRENFPETWLFDMEMVGSSGKFVTQVTLPDTITSWEGEAVCVGSKDGLGISDTASIRGFQLFFISFTLPDNAIRGEVFTVIVSITSYANGPLPITVSLDDPQGYKVVSGSVNKNICIQPGTSRNFPIKLNATTVGDVNITVRAETARNAKVCGSSASNQYARDAVTQSLVVEAEGYLVQEIKSNLFCPLGKQNQSFRSYNLSLPNGYVSESQRAYLDITGNILGPSIRNIDNLVQLPTGCGEQNLVRFVPNYLVLDYLGAIHELDDKTKSKAISNLNKGYQRELTFQRDDKSFSAFGNRDPSGSMFLTANVIRAFCNARRYITIDETVIKNAQTWIVSRQMKNGCFPDEGHIIDKPKEDGIEQNKSPTPITTYVLTSLLICKYDNQTVINMAEKCIKNNPPKVPFEIFMVAYAEALAGKKRQAQKRIDDVKPLAQTDENGAETYFNPNGTDFIDLETVAFAVLANLQLNNSLQNVNSVLGLVKDLTSKLNPNGGFYTTQDTVVGLQALAEFGKLVYSTPINLSVSVSGALNEKVKVTEDNKILVQRKQVEQVPGQLKVKTSGSGCGLIQVTLRYNSLTPPGESKYYIKVLGQCHGVNCTDRKISGTVRYLPDGKSAGFTTVTVKMITGIVPDRDGINALPGQNDNGILRADVEGNNVVLYYTDIDNNGKNFEFPVNRMVQVDNPQPGSATVVNYYNPEIKTTTTYTFEDTKAATTTAPTKAAPTKAPSPVLTTAAAKRRPNTGSENQ